MMQGAYDLQIDSLLQAATLAVGEKVKIAAGKKLEEFLKKLLK